jgi:hypothetical protein
MDLNWIKPAWEIGVAVVKWFGREKPKEPAAPRTKADKPLSKAELKKLTDSQLERRIFIGEDRVAKNEEENRFEKREIEKCKNEQRRRRAA